MTSFYNCLSFNDSWLDVKHFEHARYIDPYSFDLEYCIQLWEHYQFCLVMIKGAAEPICLRVSG